MPTSSPVKLTQSQIAVLSLVRAGKMVSGRSVSTVRVLESLGLVVNVKCHPVYDPVRGYSHSWYSAEVAPQ